MVIVPNFDCNNSYSLSNSLEFKIKSLFFIVKFNNYVPFVISPFKSELLAFSSSLSWYSKTLWPRQYFRHCLETWENRRTSSSKLLIFFRKNDQRIIPVRNLKIWSNSWVRFSLMSKLKTFSVSSLSPVLLLIFSISFWTLWKKSSKIIFDKFYLRFLSLSSLISLCNKPIKISPFLLRL